MVGAAPEEAIQGLGMAAGVPLPEAASTSAPVTGGRAVDSMPIQAHPSGCGPGDATQPYARLVDARHAPPTPGRHEPTCNVALSAARLDSSASGALSVGRSRSVLYAGAGRVDAGSEFSWATVMAPKTIKTVGVTSRPAWRRWLNTHHDSHSEIWLIFHKRHTGRPSLSYDDAVEEALCFGWVDSLIRRLDADRGCPGRC